MNKFGVLLALLLTVSCAPKAPATAAPVPGADRNVLVSKHDPASGTPDTSAVQVQPGILLHLYEVVNTTQGRFHVVAGDDVRDVTLTQGTAVTLTFGTRTLTLTLTSVNTQGANVRVEARGTT
jgi:hypothetical protein